MVSPTQMCWRYHSLPQRQQYKTLGLQERAQCVCCYINFSWMPFSSPACIGESNEYHGDEVMKEHDERILPPVVHKHGAVDGVQVEAELDHVGHSDVQRHLRINVPVCK